MHQSAEDVVRDVLSDLDSLGVDYYITGSEALAPYGEPRQTADTDIVMALDPAQFDRIEMAFRDRFVVNRPIRFPRKWLASLVARSGWGKVDLILREDDTWGRSALARRRRFDHPRYGSVWISSLEDLILAKLEWSEGQSELQLRDCANLVRLNPGLDVAYLVRFAAILGATDLLERIGVRTT